ncbi:MAG: hypothetical protein GX914_02905 [Erysipelotrichia bacterium]|nr:hypothetical protein [Erysipelotrichia bacterium]
MKFYKCNDNDPLYAFYKKDDFYYPVFVEKYGTKPVEVKDAYEITDEETILALNKYMQPYEPNKPKIYMAGPLFNEGDRYSNQLNSDALRKKGFTTFLPQEVVITNKSSELVKGACFFMDLKAIYQCDYIVANCNGIEIDSGTAAEIGMGYALNKKMYLYKSDVRNYYNERFKLNNFVSGLVDNKIYGSIEEIITELNK